MIADDKGISLLHALFAAPLIAWAPGEPSPVTLHAVTADEIVARWGEGSVSAACGVGDLKILKVGGEALVYEWPPSTRYMPERFVRCVDCHEETGRRRPRTQWKKP